jgi:hypothetical protein
MDVLANRADYSTNEFPVPRPAAPHRLRDVTANLHTIIHPD